MDNWIGETEWDTVRDDHGIEIKISISFCRITFLRMLDTFWAELEVLALVIAIMP